MHLELSIALNFLMSYLYNKLPRRRVDVFAEELEKGLLIKFQDHWYPEDSFKGSGYRSIRIIEGKIDPVFKMASQSSGLALEEILEQLPRGLTIWIDPDEVSYRIGETGQVTILYYNNKKSLKNQPFSGVDNMTPTSVISQATVTSPVNYDHLNNNHFNSILNGFSPKQETAPMNTFPGFNNYDQDIAMNLEKMRLESSNSFNAGLPYLHSLPSALPNPIQMNMPNTGNILGLTKPSANQTCFTAAAFAQTKFGSTKMKTNSNHYQSRPTRLFPSPTADLHTRLNLAAQLNALSARSPGSFIPFGLHSQLLGPWTSPNQTSAPSSCLGSPCNDFMSSPANQLFANLINQSAEQKSINLQQQVFECLPNSLLSNLGSSANNGSSAPKLSPTMNTPLLTFNDFSPSSFTSHSDSLVKQKLNLDGHLQKSDSFLPLSTCNQFQQPYMNNELMNGTQVSSLSSSPTSSSTPSKLSSISSTDNSPPTSIDSVDWNSYISNYPNLQHLLVAN